MTSIVLSLQARKGRGSGILGDGGFSRLGFQCIKHRATARPTAPAGVARLCDTNASGSLERKLPLDHVRVPDSGLLRGPLFVFVMLSWGFWARGEAGTGWDGAPRVGTWPQREQLTRLT